MAQVLLRLPDDLVDRFKATVPARRRSSFVQALLEKALPPKDPDWLYKIALEVNADEALNAEMAEWDVTSADGIDDDDWPDAPPSERAG